MTGTTKGNALDYGRYFLVVELERYDELKSRESYLSIQ